MPAKRIELMLCSGTRCVSGGAYLILDALEKELHKHNLQNEISVIITGCNGFCGQGPLLVVQPDQIFYGWLKEDDIPFLVQEHFLKGRPVKKLMFTPPEKKEPIPLLPDIPFFRKQMLVVLRNKGIIDPEKIEEYIARDGYVALDKVLTGMKPEDVIEEIKNSGLRGRSGGGFPTGIKWKLCSAEKKNPKYIICNCDEGEPGTYMARGIFESDPHTVVEGMIIGAYAIGASNGYIYTRAEYPAAIQRMQLALLQAKEYGLLGENILGSDFSFDIEIREGSGAYVCGEETSLIHSIEGKTPEPRQKPPFPTQSGLWDCPTVINNVETWANVPVIIRRGADWYSRIGTVTSKGTKIFSLVGNINNTGLIEVPMGITLREIIYEIGGGIPGNKKLKAVQTGGPSGGCISDSFIDLPIDYESLIKAGSIMGSGGMIVMDEDTCIVDLAKFLIQFSNDESCGKCTTCREGSEALLEVLAKITDGKGQEGDIEFLEELGTIIKDASMCGHGLTVPNPVLSTIKNFRNDYEAHIKYKKCPAVVCKGIISSPCQYLCPLNTDVPVYLTLTAKMQFRQALELIRKSNPLPAICGRVCIAHCETKCRAQENGGSLAVRELKRFLTDWEMESGNISDVKPFPGKYKEKIAIIGSGPGGLSAAYWLAGMGYGVTVFEKLPVAGGMLAVGIPEYRLPGKLLQFEIDMIKKTGVEIRTNTLIENIDDLLSNGYNSVLIAAGAHKNRKPGIEGEDTVVMTDPIIFLRKVRLKEEFSSLGNRVGIIGGGNTAVAAARTALRLGSEEVTIYYDRTRSEMQAPQSEIEAAINEGVKIEFLVAPTKVIPENGILKGAEFIRTEPGEPDASGQRRQVPIKDSEFIVELDSLLPAISQDPEIPDGFTVKISDWNRIMVDKETMMTDRKGVFACGDAVTGPADVTTAMAGARDATEMIHKYLRGEELKRKYKPVMPSVEVEPLKTEEKMPGITRPKMPVMQIEERKNNFKEVELGYTREMAVMEAKRCLRCDWESSKRDKEKNHETERNEESYIYETA